jgi:galactitol-specific phosphotransferase system IIB component
MPSRTIKVVFACGAGVAQCTAMDIQLRKFFKEKGWAIETKKGNYGEVPGTFRSWKPDLYITTGGTGVTVPDSIKHFDGLPLIINRGKEDLFNRIAAYLETIE